MYDDELEEVRERCLQMATQAMGQGCPLDDYLTVARAFEKYIIKGAPANAVRYVGARTRGKSS